MSDHVEKRSKVGEQVNPQVAPPAPTEAPAVTPFDRVCSSREECDYGQHPTSEFDVRIPDALVQQIDGEIIVRNADHDDNSVYGRTGIRARRRVCAPAQSTLSGKAFSERTLQRCAS